VTHPGRHRRRAPPSGGGCRSPIPAGPLESAGPTREGARMDLLLLTADPHPESVLPALELLPVTVTPAPPAPASLIAGGAADLVLLDARGDLAGARSLCRLLGRDSLGLAVLAVLTEGGLAAVGPEWGVADVALTGAGPAEVHARLRLLAARAVAGNDGVVTV